MNKRTNFLSKVSKNFILITFSTEIAVVMRSHYAKNFAPFSDISKVSSSEIPHLSVLLIFRLYSNSVLFESPWKPKISAAPILSNCDGKGVVCFWNLSLTHSVQKFNKLKLMEVNRNGSPTSPKEIPPKIWGFWVHTVHGHGRWRSSSNSVDRWKQFQRQSEEFCH